MQYMDIIRKICTATISTKTNVTCIVFITVVIDGG